MINDPDLSVEKDADIAFPSKIINMIRQDHIELVISRQFTQRELKEID
jgi:hypothetical protein